MLKKIIKPFQDGLLGRNLCVGCTGQLENSKRLGNLSDNRFMVQCKCRRRYVFDKEMNKYSRATFAEEQQILKQIKKDSE